MSLHPPGSVRRFGHGTRQSLAIHCTLAHSGAWQGLAQALPQETTLTAYDLPDHGKSADWDMSVDFQDACVFLAAPLLKAGVDLIGHSFGATVALRLAIENPTFVRSLTLIEPVFFAVAKLDDPMCFANYCSEAEPFEAAISAGNSERAARLFGEIWGDGRTWETLPARSRRYMADRMHLIPHQEASLVLDRSQLLAGKRCESADMPTVLIEGDQSPEIIGVINAGLQKRLPNALRKIVKGAGHMAPITHPTEVAVMINELLEMTEE